MPAMTPYDLGRTAAKLAMLSEHGYTREEAQTMEHRVPVPKGVTDSAFQQGLNTELEHKNVTHGSDKMTAEIALAHLKEDPKYYEKLKKVEGS